MSKIYINNNSWVFFRLKMSAKAKSADDFKKSKSSVTLLPYGQCIGWFHFRGVFVPSQT